jgi:galactokinase
LGIDDFSIYDLLLPKDWICFVTTSVLNEDEYTNVPENFRIVPSHAYLPDYIALVDVVVGKIGYGAVSECIAHKTPLVFVRRDNFAEEPNLIKFLTGLNAGFEISRAAFLSRNWCSFLEEAKSFSVKDSGVDGSIVASHMVIDVINVHESLKSKSMSLTRMQEYLRDGSHSYWRFVRQMLFSFYRNLSMNREDTIFISRAPGRLDVMGGISDYSGSHALEMPLSAGTFVAIQVSSPKIPSKPKENHVLLNLFSPTTEKVDRSDFVSINLSDVLEIEDNGSVKARDFHTVRTFLNKNTRDRGAAFVVGAFPVLARFQRVTISPQTKSITIIIGSAGLKEGAGVSSSASLEVACILSLAEALDIRLEKYQAPILAQIIENEIVGACCGIMDQLTSFLGQENKFISLKCTDPFHIDGFIPIPQNIKFWGVDSGIKRSTASSDYTCCRVAAFMGKRIINCTNAVQVLHLADLEPDEFEAVHVQTLPESITGADFIAKYGTHDDTVTQIDPCMAYSVKVCTSHPVLENYRTQTFGQILKSCHSEIGTEQRILLGNLMYDSHMSYSKCGLGTPETDLLVNLAKEIDGVFGAKITGGGGGGTVCFLTHNSAEGEQAVKSIQRQYEFQTGISTTLFHGSSQGAEGFGIVKLNLSSILDSFTQAVVS